MRVSVIFKNPVIKGDHSKQRLSILGRRRWCPARVQLKS